MENLFLPRRMEEREEKYAKEVLNIAKVIENLGGLLRIVGENEFEISLDCNREDVKEFLSSFEIPEDMFVNNKLQISI